MKLYNYVKLITLGSLLSVGCSSPSNNYQESVAEKPETKRTIPKAGPFYYEYYKPDEVSLDSVNEEEIGEETAIKILSNSCGVFKADYLNYLKEIYGHTSPEMDERELYLEAEHFGKFIVWKLVKNETECFTEFFKSSDIFYNGFSEPARVMYVNGTLKAMYDESLKYQVNVYSAFNEWFSSNTEVTWNLMIKDIEGSI